MKTAYSLSDPALGSAGTARNAIAHAAGVDICVVADAPLDASQAERLAAEHARAGAELTLLAREDPDASLGATVLICDDSGRLLGVQRDPASDEALSELVDGGAYAVSPAALLHVPQGAARWPDLLDELLSWGLHVHVATPA